MTREEIIITVAKEIMVAGFQGKSPSGDYIGDQLKILTKKVEEALDSIKK